MMVFYQYAKEISVPELKSGGLFMPCAFYAADFIRSGGYPGGHIGDIPGDVYLFYKNSVMGVKKHITVCDSIAYHVQEGELHS